MSQMQGLYGVNAAVRNALLPKSDPGIVQPRYKPIKQEEEPRPGVVGLLLDAGVQLQGPQGQVLGRRPLKPVRKLARFCKRTQ